jgi:iron complex transport system substrate-binding protein
MNPLAMMSLAPRALLALALIMTPAVAGMAPAAAGAITVRDATGRDVTISDPSRIVAIGGAITEILYALGQENRIVAVDTTSVYPERALKEKPNVGYMRQLSPEGVLGLGPTLVLASESSGPKNAMAVLDQAAVPLVRVPEHFTGDGIVERIRMVAQAVGAKARGECLAANVSADLAALTALRTQVEKPARILFVLSFMNDRPMVAGTGTAADGVIKLAGAVNATGEFNGYKIVSDEAIIAAKPDAVLVMRRPDLNLTAADVFSRPAFSLTPAAATKSLVSMEGLYLLGFGPRTARAARDLAQSLYPALDGAKLPSESDASNLCKP